MFGARDIKRRLALLEDRRLEQRMDNSTTAAIIKVEQRCAKLEAEANYQTVKALLDFDIYADAAREWGCTREMAKVRIFNMMLANNAPKPITPELFPVGSRVRYRNDRGSIGTVVARPGHFPVNGKTGERFLFVVWDCNDVVATVYPSRVVAA